MQRLRQTKRHGKRRQPETWVTVATVGQVMRADLLRLQLASAGIRCRIPGEVLANPYNYGFRSRLPLMVQVPSASAERAQSVLADSSPSDGEEAASVRPGLFGERTRVHSPFILSAGLTVMLWMISAALALAGLVWLYPWIAKRL